LWNFLRLPSNAVCAELVATWMIANGELVQDDITEILALKN
jgi:hypothetical protein